MKKVLSLVIVLCMLFSAVPVMADEVQVPRDSFLEEITRIAEERGGTVSVYGDSIVLLKDGRNMIITNDTVSYMKNGMLVTESIYLDAQYVKFPQNALMSVLGVESIDLEIQKTQAYYDKMESFKEGFQSITEKTETNWGTIVEYSGYLYIAPWGYEFYKNHLCYVRWDGQTVGISNYAPDLSDTSLMKYESIEIAEDGKTALVKYPELKNLGTICVEVDLVNCTTTKTTIPYVKKNEPVDAENDTETASGKCLGYTYLSENAPDTNVMWEYKNGTLTITGDQSMHDFYYTWGGRTENTVRTTTPWEGYMSKIKKIIITEGVKSVSRYAFDGCINLEEVVIADNVAVNTGAFHYLRNLEKVTLGKNCYLGEEAFKGCTALCEITIPEGTEVGHNAFYNCYSLNKVDFEGKSINLTDTSFINTPFYNSVDEIVLDGELLWIKNADELESYTVPEGITRIGANVFSGSKLKEIVLPQSLIEIGDGAFRSTDLITIALPVNLKKIGDEAFKFGKFTEIKFPQSLEYIGDEAFANSMLTSITIGKNVVVADAQYMDGAFYSCDNLKTVVFEDGTEKIADGMFSWCNNLESVTIPDSVKVIGRKAFEGCDSLTVLPIGKGVVEIGYGAYEDCNNITFADISHVQHIEGGIFKDCNKLNKVILNENLTEIPAELFYGCNSLTEVNIPQSILAINNYAFYFTKSLTGEFVIPDKVTYIGDAAFRQSGFTSIIMPDSVTELGTCLAEEMPNLTHIKLSESITKIPYGTFRGAKKLTKITIPDLVTEIGNSAFSDCENLDEIVIPDSVTVIGDYAFYNCKKFSEFKMPEKLTHIGKKAFLNSGIYSNDAYWTDGGLYMLNTLIAVRDDREVIKIKEGTEFIAPLVFEKTENIKEVHIPGSVKEIESNVFNNSGVKNVFINEGVEVICSNAFYFAKLESVSLPDSLKTIKKDAFSYCYNIKELVIPAKVEIEENAFEDFDAKLEKVTFKEGREELDMYGAFGYAASIKEVVLPEGLKKIGNKMFYEWKNLETINCPESLEEIGEETFYNCDKLSVFYGGESLKLIGNKAFSDCDLLKEVTFNENALLGENVFEKCPLIPHH